MSFRYKLKKRFTGSGPNITNKLPEKHGIAADSSLSAAIRDALAALLTCSDLETILDSIYKIFSEYVQCDRWAILYINQNNKLYTKYEYGPFRANRIGMEASYYRADGRVGFSYRSFNEGKIIIDNNNNSPTWNTQISLMTVPLTIFTEKIGVLLIEKKEPNSFINLDMNLLNEFSIYVAIALKNAEHLISLTSAKQEIETLYEETIAANSDLNSSIHELQLVKQQLSSKNTELGILQNALESILKNTDIDKTMENIYTFFKNYTGCDRFTITFYDVTSDEVYNRFVFADHVENEKRTPRPRHHLTGIVKHALQGKKTVCEINTLFGRRALYGDRLAMHISISEELEGVIFMETPVPESFSGLSIEVLESLSRYAALALRNANLYSSTIHQKQEIEALYEQSASFNVLLQIKNDELQKAQEELSEKNLVLLGYNQDIESAYIHTVMALSNSIEANDIYTRGHCERVMEISCEIAVRLGLDETQIRNLKYGAILHDIGKIGVSHHILNKTGKLTEEEYKEIQKHPLIAYNILRDVTFLGDCLLGILQHHERYDGKGYPNGIKGSDISIEGRILCIADAFDAMTSDRPYRGRNTIEYALSEIEKNTGSQFDPNIARCFIDMLKAYDSELFDIL